MNINPQFKAVLDKENNKLTFENEAEFYNYCQSLDCGDLSVSVEKFRNKRSIQQNRYYFLLLNIVREHTGETVNKLHSDFKRMFLPKDEINFFTGELYSSNESTTKLNTLEFTNYIEDIRQFCAENLELVLPDASNYY